MDFTGLLRNNYDFKSGIILHTIVDDNDFQVSATVSQ